MYFNTYWNVVIVNLAMRFSFQIVDNMTNMQTATVIKLGRNIVLFQKLIRYVTIVSLYIGI